MARYSIDGQILTNIADAIREKENQIKLIEYSGIITPNVGGNNEHFFVKDVQYKLTIIPTDGTTMAGVGVSLYIKDITTSKTYLIDDWRLYEGAEEIIFYSPIDGMGKLSYGTNSSGTKLYANYTITGGKSYTPTEMADAIDELNIIPKERLALTGDVSYLDYRGKWDWFFTKYNDKITMNNINNITGTFQNSLLTTFPVINLTQQTFTQAGAAFAYTNITTIPVVNNGAFSSLKSIFQRCERLVNIPDDFWINCSSYNSNSDMSGMFQNCTRLRHLPIGFINRLTGTEPYYYTALSYCGYGCSSLDDIIGIATSNAIMTSNCCQQTVSYTYRLKDFIFATNEDGSAVVRKWKNQTMDFSLSVGYGNVGSYGFTTDTKITDDESYQRLKDNPDAWTTLLAYSRYNHDSAVRTINSLPDTSAYLATAGGTNTIKFKGASGSATDGGAINTLTEEEIAVATAKGWTVSLV